MHKNVGLLAIDNVDDMHFHGLVKSIAWDWRNLFYAFEKEREPINGDRESERGDQFFLKNIILFNIKIKFMIKCIIIAHVYIFL